MPSPEVAGRVLELFETGCQVLNHSVTAFFELETSAAEQSLQRAKGHDEKLTGMLERLRHAGEGTALIAAVSRVALEARSANHEIAAFVTAYTPEKARIPGAETASRIRVSRS